MADTVRIRNVSPLGALDLPLIGRIIGYGETFDVDADIAGTVPVVAEVDGVDTVVDYGSGLLAQSFNYAPADAPWTPVIGLIDPETTDPDLRALLSAPSAAPKSKAPKA